MSSVIENGIEIDILANRLHIQLRISFFVSISHAIQCTSTFSIIYYYVILCYRLRVDTMKTVWISPIFVLLRFHNSLMKFILNRCNLSFYTLIKLHTSHFHLYYIHSIFFLI